MMARYYSSSLARFMAVDPGNDTQLENPQSWNKYAYVRNNPLNSTDPTGQDAINDTTDPATHLAVDALASSPTYQIAMDNPAVTQTFTNESFDANVCGPGEDGGASDVQYSPSTGTTTINTSIDPSMAGAASADSGLISPGQVGTPAAVEAIVNVEAAVGVLATEDPKGTAAEAQEGGHAQIDERKAIAKQIKSETSKKND